MKVVVGRCFFVTLSYFIGELTPQLPYQNYVPISATYGIKGVTFLLRQRSAWKKSKVESVFLLTLLILLSICKSEVDENVLFLTLP